MVVLDSTRVGRDASRIAGEVIAHLSGLVGAQVTVTLEVEAEIPSGAPRRRNAARSFRLTRFSRGTDRALATLRNSVLSEPQRPDEAGWTGLIAKTHGSPSPRAFWRLAGGSKIRV